MSNESAIKVWDEKIAALESAEAVVSDVALKFGLEKQLEEARAKRRTLLEEGIQSGELGWEHIDQPLLSAFFDECARYKKNYFERMAQGDRAAIAERTSRAPLSKKSSYYRGYEHGPLE